MKILVTGATGFIGKALTLNLLQSGIHEIHLLLRPQSKTDELFKNVRFLVDTGKDKDLVDYFILNNIEGVIHLATMFKGEHDIQDIAPLINSNILFGTRLLELSAQLNVRWFINTSSCWQHFNNLLNNPINLYAATKQAFEEVISYYRATSNLLIISLELYDNFGPFDNRRKLFQILKSLIPLDNNNIEFSGGEQKLNMLYIDDVISGYLKVIDRLSNNSHFDESKYCIAAESSHSLRHIVKLFEKVYETQLNILWGAKEYKEREYMNPLILYPIIPDWKPKYSLEEGIIAMKSAEQGE